MAGPQPPLPSPRRESLRGSSFAAPLPTGHECRCEDEGNEDAEAEDEYVRPQFACSLTREREPRSSSVPATRASPSRGRSPDDLSGVSPAGLSPSQVGSTGKMPLSPSQRVPPRSPSSIARMRNRSPSRSEQPRGDFCLIHGPSLTHLEREAGAVCVPRVASGHGAFDYRPPVCPALPPGSLAPRWPRTCRRLPSEAVGATRQGRGLVSAAALTIATSRYFRGVRKPVVVKVTPPPKSPVHVIRFLRPNALSYATKFSPFTVNTKDWETKILVELTAKAS